MAKDRGYEVIGEKKLRALFNSAKTTRARTSEIAGALGEEIKTAIEKNHLHRKAFRAVLAEDRMEPEHLAEYYEQLDYYRDALGLVERAKSAPRFPDNVVELQEA